MLFSLCWSEEIAPLNETALGLSGSAERYLETTQLGRAFAIAAAVWSGAAKPAAAVAYPIAAGVACKDFGLPRELALIAFLQGFFGGTGVGGGAACAARPNPWPCGAPRPVACHCQCGPPRPQRHAG